ncbi:SAM-dependent methyltransferase [Citreimonas salinaria]|uniref:Spermidine synthase n=1 Tax=Citreimonas salinaria TaxID=321339 RepID=A0A1H3NX84_9RHOB|nr:SAM-dependent methyltransferase [Citreimonas salinaria]SDY93497.1 Spermidine synthase [Citreimonas salinaria]
MNRPTLFAVAVVSAAILAYQVLLVRLLAIISWHHFAYMIISIALLGFGASGTVLALTRARVVPHFTAAFATCAAFFGATAVGAFAILARLPFNPLALVWDPQQMIWLGASYGVLVLPFFFGGAAVGLAFTRHAAEIGRLYAYDLVGAGVGALGMVGILFLVTPAVALRLVSAAGLLSAALILLPSARRGPRLAAVSFAALALLSAAWLPSGLTAIQPHVSQFKGLPMALRTPDARVIAERSSPLGLISVVASPTIPFRYAPGLSLANTIEPPEQLGIFTDADSLSTITRFTGELEPLGYLDYTTSALPYHVVEEPETLILGAGGGEQVLLALYHGAREIDAVELNPQLADLVADQYAEFAGGIYDLPRVDLHVAEARSFIERTRKRYDLIQIPLLYSFGAASAGTQSLHESYTYTVEALQKYLETLEPGGVLSITLWAKLPPRDSVKLFATAVEALRERGAVDPGRQLAMVRSWKTATLIVKNGELAQAEIASLKEFARARSFDLAWYPGIRAEEANRFNILEHPYFFEAATALLGREADAFIGTYKFAISPATDDRPFFNDFFEWRFLPELFELRRQGAAAMLDMGYLILFATLVQAIVLSLLLIVAPLLLRRRGFAGSTPKTGVSLYFLALGLGFLFIEIAYIQRFILFLGHPLYAVAVILAGFLVFAGVGSALASRLDRAMARWGAQSVLGRKIGAIELSALGVAVLATLYLFLLPPLLEALIAWPDAIKIAVTLVLVAPLACLMGMPFPLGVALIARANPDLVPWAWGINGCASVVAAILATLLAIHAGFTATIVLAAVVYLLAPIGLR